MTRDVSDVRAFFGLSPPPAIHSLLRGRVDALRVLPWGRSVRWVAPTNIHLTLRFLGDIQAARLSVLEARARMALERSPAFAFELGAVGLFPRASLRSDVAPGGESAESARSGAARGASSRARRARVVVVHLDRCAALETLAHTLEDAAVAEGLRAESRPFRPHITLGRIRGRLSPVPVLDPTPLAASWVVDHVMLFRSTLLRSGAVYDVLARLPLARSSDVSA
jgi:2'-5' RNA ligase